MNCRIAYICGRQGLSILPALIDLAGPENFAGFLSPAAWREQDEALAAAACTSPIASPAQLARQIAHFQPDVIFVMTYLEKLDIALGDLARYGMVNIHPSLLPKYRGGAPVFYVLKDGMETTGVSFHFMSEQFDQGAVIAQASVRIGADDCASSVWLKLTRKILGLLPELVGQRDSWSANAFAQDESAATYVGFPSAAERSLSNQKTSADNLATIRACGRTVGAALLVCGKPVHVTKARAWLDADEHAGAAAFVIDDNALLMRTGDGWIRIVEAFADGKAVGDWPAFKAAAEASHAGPAPRILHLS